MRPILALFLLVCGQYASGQSTDGRKDVNGPYHVTLAHSNDAPNICSGTIVDDRWILTVARCYYGYVKENSTALVGANDLKTGGTSYLIDRFIVHGRFKNNPFFVTHDIALVRLKAPLVYNKFVEKIEIEDHYVPDNATLTTAGNIVTVLPLEDCIRQYNLTGFAHLLDVSKLCTISPERPELRTATLRKDGTGLIWKGKLVGVYIHNHPFYRHIPNANARISYYHDWIRTTIANNSDEDAITDRPSVRN